MKTQQQPDPVVTFYHRFQRVAALLESAVSKSIQHTDLTMSQYNTLRILADRGPLAQRDIAEQLPKTGGNVTLVVDHLSSRGLVVRNRDTVDRRVIYVSLTDAGQKLLSELAPQHDALVKSLFSSISASDLSQLGKVFDTLAPERAKASH